MDNIFASLPSPGRKAIKRTYSRRGQCLADELPMFGLATPPTSSSPPATPTRPSSANRAVQTKLPLLKDLTNTSNVQRTLPKSEPTSAMSAKKRKEVGDASTVPAKRPLVQMQLNLLPSRVTCKLCGMSYNRTVADDAKMHTRFHQALLQGIPVPPALNALLGQSGEEAQVASLPGVVMYTLSTRTKGVASRNFIKRVCEMVDVELGSTLPPLDTHDYRAFCVCHAGRCIAFVLVQNVDKAYPLKSNNELDLAREEQVDMGISRMWTARPFRRKGVMSALMAFVRRHGGEQDGDQKENKGMHMAFTQLSGSGEAFVRSFFDATEPLIYMG